MKRLWRVITAFGVVVVVLGVWGITLLRHNPTAAFWDMLGSNLASPGVTKTVTQNSHGLVVSQYTQLSFGAHPTAHALTVFSQNGGSIATEEISDRTNDFVRYQKIVTNQKNTAGKTLDVSSVVGQWAKLASGSDLSSTVTSGLFDQSLLGVLPIANLDPAARSQLLQYMHSNDVFSFDASHVKTATVADHKVYQYAVSIKPAPYVALMQQFGKLIGATQYANLDPNNYSTSAAITATISVDSRSHQLVEINQAAGSHIEQYQGFGITAQTALPHATLSTAQLEQRITNLR